MKKPRHTVNTAGGAFYLSGIPEKQRADAERGVLAIVAELYREAGGRPPI